MNDIESTTKDTDKVQTYSNNTIRQPCWKDLECKVSKAIFGHEVIALRLVHYADITLFAIIIQNIDLNSTDLQPIVVGISCRRNVMLNNSSVASQVL